MKVLAVDPGLVSGYVWVEGDRLARHGQVSPMEMCNIIETAANTFEADVFVYERFQITTATAKHSPQPHAMEIIGVMKYFAHIYSIPLVEQKPVDAKRFSTDKKLKEYGLYTTSMDHARDAARHYLLWRTKESGLPRGVDFGAR